MNFQGVFTKMTTEIGEPIQYYLKFEEDFVNMNLLINKELELEFVKNQCLGCDKDLEIYRQGHCKSCFFELPQTADWIVKPELSKAHLGIEDRDLEYEKSVQLQPHIRSPKVQLRVSAIIPMLYHPVEFQITLYS